MVLGGGLSGLYAAAILKNSGYSVRIVEASPRLGGRIKTFSQGGITQDLGGEWIGEGQKDIQLLAKNLGLELKRSPLSPLFQLTKDPGSLLSLQGLSFETLQKMIDLHKSLGVSQRQGLDKIDFLTYARYQGVSEEDVSKLNETYRIFLGSSLQNVSSDAVLSDLASLESGLRADYFVSGGAQGLIDGLQRSFSPTEIVLGDPVIKVTQFKKEVQLELSSGRLLKSSILVCTIPSIHALELKWSPSLPKDLLYTFLRIPYGKLQKNLMLFNKSKIEPQLSLTETPGQVLYVSSEDSSNSEFSAITSLVSGDRVSQMDGMSLDGKKELLLTSLKDSSFSNFGTPEEFVFGGFPKFVQRASISLFPPGSYGLKDAKLQFERVFFAGEHLAEHNGTMEGAVASALKAVNSI